jgi:hypothetical protein
MPVRVSYTNPALNSNVSPFRGTAKAPLILLTAMAAVRLRFMNHETWNRNRTWDFEAVVGKYSEWRSFVARVRRTWVAQGSKKQSALQIKGNNDSTSTRLAVSLVRSPNLFIRLS